MASVNTAIPNAPRPLSYAASALMCLALVAYLPAIRAGYVWDDDTLLTQNPNIRSAEGLARTWFNPRANLDYYPLTFTSWWIEYRLYGLQPLGYHLVNVFLHGINAILVWTILRRLALPGAWMVAAIFAVHPVHVESVAWVAERKNGLSGFFYLLTLWYFLKSYSVEDPSPGPPQRRPYVLSLVFFTCALLAKPLTMTLAAALPLIAWWKRGRLTVRDLATVAPYFLIAAPMAMLTMWVQRYHVSAVGPEFEHSLLDRCLIAGQTLWFYAGKLAWPTELSFAYPLWKIDAASGWQYLPLLGAVAVLVALWILRRRVGRGPLAAVLFFIVTLSPALGFINTYWQKWYFVADHIQYLASLGLTALAVAAVTPWLARLARNREIVGRAACAGVLAPLAILTFNQSCLYENQEKLWTDVLRKNPDCWMALNNLAGYYSDLERWDKALPYYDQTIACNPTYADAYYNRGVTYFHLEHYDKAVADHTRAIELNPDSAVAYNGRGNAYGALGRYDLAITDYTQAIALKTTYAGAYNNRGYAYQQLGSFDKALADFSMAVDLNPNFAMAYENRADTYLRLARYDQAIADYSKAVALQPDNATACLNLAIAFFKTERYADAWTALEKSKALGGLPDPEFVRALSAASGRSP